MYNVRFLGTVQRDLDMRLEGEFMVALKRWIEDKKDAVDLRSVINCVATKDEFKFYQDGVD